MTRNMHPSHVIVEWHASEMKNMRDAPNYRQDVVNAITQFAILLLKLVWNERDD